MGIAIQAAIPKAAKRRIMMKQGGHGESTPAASHEPEKEPVVRKTVQQLIDEKRKAKGVATNSARAP